MSGLMQLGKLVLSRYKVTDFVGNGGEGDVAKGVDQDTGHAVAIKHLSASPDEPHYQQQVARLERAGRVRIGHPCIVDAIAHGKEGGEWYLVMPFVEGLDLEMHLRACGGKCPMEQAVSIISDLADGLSAVHNKGIVHRDIKPLNIIIRSDGRPKLLDFGICRNVHEKTISNGGIVGTLAWMSPEQTVDSAGVDHRSDLFSLALLTHYILIGIPPVQANDPETAKRIIREGTIPSLRQLDPSIPVHIDAVCKRLLAKRPEDRFQSAMEFRQALNGSGLQQGAGFCPSCGMALLCPASFCSSCGAGFNAPRTAVLCLACGGAADKASVCPGCQRPFSPNDHRLVFDAGTVAGKTFRIPEGLFDVGRDVIEPRDFSISRCHCRIACSNGTVHVQDAGSANKTYVAGQLAERPMQLRPQQEFLIATNHAIYLSQ